MSNFTTLIHPILAQIDAMGGVSASWVLVIVTGIAGTLFWIQLKDIKTSLSDISKLVQLHDKEIAVMKATKKDKDEDE